MQVYHVQVCKAAAVRALKSILDDRLRVVVFDDGDQTHCVWLPFSEISQGKVTYKEPNDVVKLPKEQLDQMNSFHLTFYDAQTIDRVKRWIHCSGDLRKGQINLDLDYCTYGRLNLGEGMKRKAGKNVRKTYDDSTYVRYTLHFHDEYKNDIGMSWFRIHEIRVPISRLKHGVSNMFI